MGVEYVPLEDLLRQSDIVSLHVPLIPSTERLINKERIQMMKPGAMLINVSRGGLIDTDAVLHGLETGCLGAVGLDVFETESSLFFEDWSPTYSGRLSGWDRRLSLLTSLPNVIVTPHSAFLTKDALANIVKVRPGGLAACVEAGRASGSRGERRNG